MSEDEEKGDEEPVEIFEKPKKKKIEIEVKEKPKKKRKPLSETQLENLRKAREKSVAKRRALKEAKEVEKAARKIKKDKEKEARLEKKMEQDEIIELKAQMKLEAESQAHWSEDRLMSLMEKTLDKYIEKKKAAKPQPRVQIPAPVSNPQMPQAPLDPKYYMPQSQQPQFYAPKYQYHNQPPVNNDKDPSLRSLFGNY